MDLPHSLHMNSRPDSTHLTSALDEAFLARVHKTSLFMTGLVAVLASVSTIGGNWALGFLGAALWSIANLWTLERMIRVSLQPDVKHSKIELTIGLLVKLPLLYALLALFVIKGGFAAAPVLIGVGVPLLVIIFKVAGRMLVVRMRATGPGLPQPRS
ncbi:hypothetical protein DRQ53_14370 [bacterium]|nr:MAG: hypothetical protein DRQ32_03445 [bacterium]RKZ12738.1 MAG: hypothetical protein DRQ53_14370 [bacterium]